MSALASNPESPVAALNAFQGALPECLAAIQSQTKVEMAALVIG